jgi:hypothetical protein
MTARYSGIDGYGGNTPSRPYLAFQDAARPTVAPLRSPIIVGANRI